MSQRCGLKILKKAVSLQSTQAQLVAASLADHAPQHRKKLT
jgi:hypothetical protein